MEGPFSATSGPDALTPYTARKDAEPNKAKREDVK
jgi:hypothetical protein